MASWNYRNVISICFSVCDLLYILMFLLLHTHTDTHTQHLISFYLPSFPHSAIFGGYWWWTPSFPSQAVVFQDRNVTKWERSRVQLETTGLELVHSVSNGSLGWFLWSQCSCVLHGWVHATLCLPETFVLEEKMVLIVYDIKWKSKRWSIMKLVIFWCLASKSFLPKNMPKIGGSKTPLPQSKPKWADILQSHCLAAREEAQSTGYYCQVCQVMREWQKVLGQLEVNSMV